MFTETRIVMFACFHLMKTARLSGSFLSEYRYLSYTRGVLSKLEKHVTRVV